MGKGDKKTAKGKRFLGSFGKTRPQKVKKTTVATTPKAKPAKKVAAEAAEPKTKAPRKTAAKKKKTDNTSEV
jgi:ribosomal small subunit protein bTHX